jgi:hypothetical protein
MIIYSYSASQTIYKRNRTNYNGKHAEGAVKTFKILKANKLPILVTTADAWIRLLDIGFLLFLELGSQFVV